MSINVQIFCLKSKQEYLDQHIVPILKEQAFKNMDIEIECMAISDDYPSIEDNSKEHIFFARYVRLLTASMVKKADDFAIVVADNEGRWSYAGGAYSGYGGDPEGLNLLYLYKDTMTSAFPAVAVMDRMIMVPRGIHEALSGGLPWFLKPLEVGGVMLVDFEAPSWFSEVARQVGIWLKTEIAKLCRRHMFARKFPNPNLDKLAEVLQIDKNYLKQHQNEILAFTPLVELTAEIVKSSPAQLGKLSRITVDIRNESETVLEHVRVLVRSPGMEWASMLKPEEGITDFPPRGAGTQRIEFDITPKAVPFCPLEIRFEMSGTSQIYARSSIPLILDVSS